MEIDSTDPVRSLRPPRRRGFPADLSLGFYLYAPVRLIYFDACPRPDPDGWHLHRFVTTSGRLVRLHLPANTKLYLRPAAHGVWPAKSVVEAQAVFGRVPPNSLAALPSGVLCRLHKLWRYHVFFRAEGLADVNCPEQESPRAEGPTPM